MQEKYQGLGVLGIKLASMQRQEVVSHHLFCIFIIRQCAEVYVTKKKKERKEESKKGKRFPAKYPLIQMRWFPSPQPWEAHACISICPPALAFALTLPIRHSRGARDGVAPD